jgi:hypothetical protein
VAASAEINRLPIAAEASKPDTDVLDSATTERVLTEPVALTEKTDVLASATTDRSPTEATTAGAIRVTMDDSETPNALKAAPEKEVIPNIGCPYVLEITQV